MMASITTKIQRVEFSSTCATPHCPFCGTQVLKVDADDNYQVAPCTHTLFIATDEGMEYRSERFDALKGISGVSSDKIDAGDDGFDGYTNELEISGAVKFAVYSPAPSFFGAYIGFAPAG